MQTALQVTACTFPEPYLETYTWGPGMHDTYTIHYVISGEGFFSVNKKTYPLKEGDSFFSSPNQVVHYYPNPQNPWKYSWVNFVGYEAASLIDLTSFAACPVCYTSQSPLDIFDRFSNSPALISTLRNEGFVRVLLAHYIEYYPAKETESPNNWLALAKKHIKANLFSHELNVTSLAHSIGLERTYLYRLFIADTGISPSEYITNLRMEKAVQLMQDGLSKVTVISSSVGYSDPLYFSTCFKKKYGMSPKQYISQLQK